MAYALIEDRSTIDVVGHDSAHFLQNLITCDIETLDDTNIIPGALLTPQGKIAFDFLIFKRDEQRFTIDISSNNCDDFVKRLSLYKLRSKVEIHKQEQAPIGVCFDCDSSASSFESARLDVRFKAIQNVWRIYGDQHVHDVDSTAKDWDAFRIVNGIPQSGDDFELGSVFPHDALLDFLGGVSFTKGCYVGQEVVSRMHHRQSARKRFVSVQASGGVLPLSGSPINSDSIQLGTLGSVSDEHALALVRIDRVAKVLAGKGKIYANDIELHLSVPAFCNFSLQQLTDQDAKDFEAKAND